MDTPTVVAVLVVVMIVVVILLLVRAAVGRSSVGSLRPLAPESRERYVAEWDRAEAGFIDAPEESVRQAEALLMSLLRERGHPLSERDLPHEMREAHKLGYRAKDRTELMRQALLHYRAAMERMLGPEPQRSRAEEQPRRELA